MNTVTYFAYISLQYTLLNHAQQYTCHTLKKADSNSISLAHTSIHTKTAMKRTCEKQHKRKPPQKKEKKKREREINSTLS